MNIHRVKVHGDWLITSEGLQITCMLDLMSNPDSCYHMMLPVSGAIAEEDQCVRLLAL